MIGEPVCAMKMRNPSGSVTSAKVVSWYRYSFNSTDQIGELIDQYRLHILGFVCGWVSHLGLTEDIPGSCTGVCLAGRQWTRLDLKVDRPPKAGQRILCHRKLAI